MAAVIELAGRHAPWLSDRLAFTDRHTLWITPLSYLLFLLPVGAGAALVTSVLPPLRSFGARCFMQLLPAVFGVAWMLSARIHRFAILILAIGLAVQMSRMAAARPSAARLAARWATLFSAAVTIAGIVIAWAAPAVGERMALRSLPASSAGAPNILLLVLDTVRAPSMSAYGYHRSTTPSIQEFSRTATLFRNAYATTSWTLPSHASMFTGRYPYELSADWEVPLDGRYPVLAEVFRDAGYRTGGFVGNIEYASAEAGLGRGFLHFEDWPVSFPRIASESSLGFFILDNRATRRVLDHHEPYVQRRAVDVIDGFLKWKDRRAGRGRPYFAFLNLYDAHAPCIPPAPYFGQFGATTARQRVMTFGRMNGGALKPRQPLTAAELDEEQRAYDSGIAYLDAEIGRLLTTLRNAGELDTTMVVITSDHGEHFGEFGLRSHGTALYGPGLHVPLLIAYPSKVPKNTVIDHAVTLRDLPATLLDLAGVSGHPIPGTTLASTWGPPEGPARASMVLSELWPPRNIEPAVPVAGGYMRSLMDWPLQLIVREDDTVEFLDLTKPDNAAIVNTPETRRQGLDQRLRALPTTPYPDRIK